MTAESPLLFAMIPVLFLLFAVALAGLWLFNRNLVAARWGSLAFVIAAIGVALDAMRPPSQNWGLLFFHVGVLYCFIRALAARHGEGAPPMATTMLGLTVLAVTLLSTTAINVNNRMIAFHLGTLLALLPLLAMAWRWRLRSTVDRMVMALVAGLVLSYALRAGMLLERPLPANVVDRHSFFAIRENILFHLFIALTGCLAGLTLIFALGYDLLIDQSVRSVTDALTGLGNRHALRDALTLDRRRRWHCGGVVSIDLDHFKRVNDDHGHAVGDALLRMVAAALRQTVGPSERLFRVGGEEFLLLVDASRVDQLEPLARAARGAVAAIHLGNRGTEIRPTASVGWRRRVDGESIADAMRRADEAMYRAKQGGRDRVEEATGPAPVSNDDGRAVA